MRTLPELFMGSAGSASTSIAALDVDADDLQDTVEALRQRGGSVAARVADVADTPALRSAIEALVNELGQFHGVFANAAVLPPPVAVEALERAEWDRLVGVNLGGAVFTLAFAAPHVVDGGSLIVTGSSMALRPREQRLAYVAAKAGLHAAARALALELAPRGIRVNVVAPGLTDTPMVRRIPGHIQTGLPDVPLGALVPPAEVAALAIHLLSDDARHVTGAVFSIDGGRTAG